MKFLRRPANQNLLLMLAVVLALAGTAGFFGMHANAIQQGAKQIWDSANELRQGEISDPEGWGILIQGMGAGLGVFGAAVLYFVALLAASAAVLLLALLLLAYFLVQKAPGHFLAYRILMGLAYGIHLVFLCVLASFCQKEESPWMLLGIVLLAGILLVNLFNTYTGRIRNG